MAKVIPLHHTAKAFNDARAIGNPVPTDNIVDFERHRISRVYRRMCAEIDRFDGPPRQYRIQTRIGFDPPIPLWFRIYIAVALVVSVGVWFL